MLTMPRNGAANEGLTGDDWALETCSAGTLSTFDNVRGYSGQMTSIRTALTGSKQNMSECTGGLAACRLRHVLRGEERDALEPENPTSALTHTRWGNRTKVEIPRKRFGRSGKMRPSIRKPFVVT